MMTEVKTERIQSEKLISVNDVVKVYSTAAGHFTALRQISFEVNRGEFLGVVGKSGAGKSTLLNMISGVDRLTEGEVLFHSDRGEVFIHDLSEDQISRWRGNSVGVIYQSFQLLPMLTLVENVTLPMDLCGQYQPRRSRQRALELLRLVEIEEHADKLPAHISGGQQQRVAIARALANNPALLIADEPTGSLDSLTANRIFELFESLVAEQGMTIVMVTHDHATVPRFSRALGIEDGSLVDIQPGSGV